jgi:YVTN family beta-propeller protein
MTPDGSKIYTAQNGDDASTVITVATGATQTIALGSRPLAVAMSPDGSVAYVSNNFDDNVSVINTATDTVVGTPIAIGQAPWGIAFAPDGAKAFVAYGTKFVAVVNTATKTVAGTLTVGNGPAFVAIQPDPQPQTQIAASSGGAFGLFSAAGLWLFACAALVRRRTTATR